MNITKISETASNCPVEATLSVLGGKYKAIILFHLLEKKMRFSELKRIMPGVTPKMLTNQLRELEGDGVIFRKVYPVVPPHTEYGITEYGKTLMPILAEMCEWGKMHMKEKINQGE